MTAPTASDTAAEVVVTGPAVNGEIPIRLPVLVIEGLDTSDGRYIAPGALSYRALPISLLAQPESAHGGDDAGAAGVVGRIDTLTRTPGPQVISRRTGKPFPEGTYVWSGTGVLIEGAKVGSYDIARLFTSGALRGLSVDLAGMDYEVLGDTGGPLDPANPRRRIVTHAAEIAAATLVPIPAFGDCYAELADAPEASFEPLPAEELPQGLSAAASPAWRSPEVGDMCGLCAAGIEVPSGEVELQLPLDAVDQLADVIAAGEGQQRDALQLAQDIVEYIRTAWADRDDDLDDGEGMLPDEQQPAGRVAVVAAGLTAKDRRRAAEKGQAMPDGSFPIRNGDDLDRAIQAVGRAKDVKAARRHIIRRAKAIGLENRIPEHWRADGSTRDEAAHAAEPVVAGEQPAADAPGGDGDPAAPQKCEFGDEPAVRSLLFRDGEAYVAVCDAHEQDARDTLAASGEEVTGVVEIGSDSEAGPGSGDLDSVVAAAAPRPPAWWFTDPKLDGPTPLQVTEDGRVYGHLATWGQCHVSFPNQCVTPPRSSSGYAYFRVGAVLCDDGTEVAVGHITLDTGHAAPELGRHAAAAHYDNTGTVVADVAAGEDEYGIWVAGALRPHVDELTRAKLRASALSGDWRRVGDGLELVAALAVNTPGFPIPRARVAAGAPLSLVAAGVVRQGTQAPVVDAAGGLDPDALADRIAERIEQRRSEVELAAQTEQLLAELDETPQRTAALLAELDETPARFAMMLAELEDGDVAPKAGA
ncbi:hypothetical protein SAMN05443637_1354 [Pseudonocardia thermophila]|uniref:Uncharacterized protein n=1 Tax=Pseudonocardia thermophila TaxID=1848 RepID=A0A1M7BCZ3_PSETH|nr:hypothetical protein [Pseudonocardia thermophila]SHL52880.1 hypothetical protein SAMN05443637_1354 [Pseudonocardia thermophila]